MKQTGKGEAAMRRHALSAVLAVILGLGAFGPADAQPGGRGPGVGPMFGGRGPMGFPGVELSDEQRQQIREILNEARGSRQTPPAGMDLHHQLRVELLADVPDEQRIATLREQIAAAHAEQLSRQIALQQKLAQVLTPEQRAQAREALANRAERRGQRGGRGAAGVPGDPRG